jgi:hypothetical protein
MAIGHVKSEVGEKERGDRQSGSPNPIELGMYIEMCIALAAVLGLLAIGAVIGYLMSTDWSSSIHRLQDML